MACTTNVSPGTDARQQHDSETSGPAVHSVQSVLAPRSLASDCWRTLPHFGAAIIINSNLNQLKLGCIHADFCNQISSESDLILNFVEFKLNF